MQTVTSSLQVRWSVHDNWTEILVGTHFVLTGPLSQQNPKIPTIHLTRNVLITSHQMVEVMFFNTMRRYVNDRTGDLAADVVAKITKGLETQIGIKRAMTDWPQMLTGRPFDRSREPFSSQERLRTLRNETIHWPAMSAVTNLADAAYYTALVASEHIYAHFYDWETSSYKEFVKSHPARCNTYVVKAMQDLKKTL